MSEPPWVGVLGARSLVGRHLLPLVTMRSARVLAVSRSQATPTQQALITWCLPGDPPAVASPLPDWIALCPIWTVAAHLPWLESLGVQRLVALSSMSVATKTGSPDAQERRLAGRLAAAEEGLLDWADSSGVGLTILRPTMIYDGLHDRNVAAIAACVRRCGWFPLCGAAEGLRQPVHAGDVAAACVAALKRDPPRRSYTLSGGEPLPFRELVERTCRAHGLTPRTLSLPPWLWRTLATVAERVGLMPGSAVGIGQRMNEDLSASHAEAALDLGFAPRPFVPGSGRWAADAAASLASPAAVETVSPGVHSQLYRPPHAP
ncbi:MAG: NAD-dependent epimerase/dehydratase family protein [Planctomycetota bacterium]